MRIDTLIKNAQRIAQLTRIDGANSKATIRTIALRMEQELKKMKEETK